MLIDMMKAVSLFVLCLCAPPLAAQGITGIAPPVELGVAADSEGLSVVDRWRADPGTVFDAAEVDLSDLLYIARPVVIMAQSPNDPMVSEQLDLLLSRIDELIVRDVILIVDTAPDAESDARETLRPNGFALVLMGKDGRVYLRKAVPWDVRELTRSIDKMPLRQQEIRNGAQE